jgi:hypothetical protein
MDQLRRTSVVNSSDKWRRELRLWVIGSALAKIALLATIWTLFFRTGAS